MQDANHSTRSPTVVVGIALVLLGSAFTGCITGDSGSGGSLTQTGSSTVLPLAQRWSEGFQQASVDVSGGGSSNGLNSLLEGEADLGDASRKITAEDYTDAGCQVSEEAIQQARSGEHPWTYPECNGVTPTEWVVAYDVLTVVTHPETDWIDEGLNYTQLRAIFTTEDTAETWDEVPGLEGAPSEKIQVYAPDQASGTYEFFFEEIADTTETSLLAAGSDRYSPSADDNVILGAIASTEHSIGFFGLSYYVENKDRVEALAIQGPDTDRSVEPGFDSAEAYPLTRPLHVYTDGVPQGNETKSNVIRDYLSFILSDEGQSVVPDIGYVKVADFSPGIHQAQVSALEQGAPNR